MPPSASVEFGPPPDVLMGMYDESKAFSPSRGEGTAPAITARPILMQERACISPDRGLRHEYPQRLLKELAEQNAFDEHMIGRIRERHAQENKVPGVFANSGLPQPPVDVFERGPLAEHIRAVLEPVMKDTRNNTAVVRAGSLGRKHAQAQYSNIPQNVAEQLQRLESERDEARERAAQLSERVHASRDVLQRLGVEAGLQRHSAADVPPEVGQLLSRLDAINADSTAHISRARNETVSLKQQLDTLERDRVALLAAQASRRKELETTVPPPLTEQPQISTSLPALRSQVQALVGGGLGGAAGVSPQRPASTRQWFGGAAPQMGGPAQGGLRSY